MALTSPFYRSKIYVQRGAGLGGIFRSLWQLIRPAATSIIKTGQSALRSDLGQTLAKAATESGLSLASSALRGEDLKESFRKSTKEGRVKAADALDRKRTALSTTTTRGSGKRRRRGGRVGNRGISLFA